MNYFEILLLIAIFILIIALIAGLFIINLHQNNNRNQNVQAGIDKDFYDFSNKFTNELSNLSLNTFNKINYLEQQIKQDLSLNNQKTNEVFFKLNERMLKIDENQKALNELSSNINSLQATLVDKKSRGIFGEIELYSLLETAFGTNEKRFARQYSLSNGTKVDALIFGPENIGNICIDSKFPLENYRRIYDEKLNEFEREKAKVAFKNDVLKHINDIKNKYIIPGETADLAYMFIPAEAIFAEIYSNFEEIVTKSYEAKVYIVSPTTLMAYLTAIRSIYLGLKKNENAMEIQKCLNDLAIEFLRLKERTENLQRDFEKIIPDFEKVALTSNKIIKRFAALNKGDVDHD